MDNPSTFARAEPAVVGCILGTAVGDAIGLPYEGLSRRRAARLLGEPNRHRLLFGRGLVSDDTEHTCMVAQALIAALGDEEVFLRHLAQSLRLWLLALPAGVGFATMRACARLWMGISPERSGVYSAGNGPAMRSAIIGVAAPSTEAMLRLVRISTRITHTDPKAEYGAVAVAVAARGSLLDGSLRADRYFANLRAALPTPQADVVLRRLHQAAESVELGETTPAFADSLGLERGVSGYVYDSVPVAIHACLSHPTDLRAAIMNTIACGGDTDTTAAIVGGIVGAAVGKNGIPPQWLARLVDSPRSVVWMERLASCLHRAMSGNEPVPVPRLSTLGILSRNLVFLFVVLFHGFRRLLPPY